MNVVQLPTPIGVLAFSESQVKLIESVRGQPLPELPRTDGIPDFTDEEVLMTLEDGGNPERALMHRRIH